MVILRSPPTDMPAIPISQPLMTSPDPSLNVNGLPDLLAVKQLVNGTRSIVKNKLTIKHLAIVKFADIAHGYTSSFLARRTST